MLPSRRISTRRPYIISKIRPQILFPEFIGDVGQCIGDRIAVLASQIRIPNRGTIAAGRVRLVPIAIGGQQGVILAATQHVSTTVLPRRICLEVASGTLQSTMKWRVATRGSRLQAIVEITAISALEQPIVGGCGNWKRGHTAPYRNSIPITPVPDGVEPDTIIFPKTPECLRGPRLGHLVPRPMIVVPVGKILQLISLCPRRKHIAIFIFHGTCGGGVLPLPIDRGRVAYV